MPPRRCPLQLATLGLAEELHHELRAAGGEELLERVAVVALCPAIVTTELLRSGERAAVGGDGGVGGVGTPRAEAARDGDVASALTVAAFRGIWDRGMPAAHAAAEVFAHARDGRFYCILDNTLERDGLSLGVERKMNDRLSAILTREIAPHSISRTRVADVAAPTTRGRSGEEEEEAAAEARELMRSKM